MIFGAAKRKAGKLSESIFASLSNPIRRHYTPEEILGYIYAILQQPNTAIATRNSCASTFRVCLFPRGLRISSGCRCSAGRWCKRISCASFRARVRQVSRQGRPCGRRCALFARGPVDRDQQDSKLQARAAGRLGFSHRRLSGARQISEIAQGPEAVARRNRPCRRRRRHLAFTIDQMARIDEAYMAAFPDSGGERRG